MSTPETPEELREGRFTTHEAFGPRARPERCEDEWPPAMLMGDALSKIDKWEVGCRDWRLTLLCWLQAIQTVAVVGGAYLFFRWARIACWLTGCG